MHVKCENCFLFPPAERETTARFPPSTFSGRRRESVKPTLLPGPKQQSDLLDELSALRLSSAELGVLCRGRPTGPGGASNTQPERIMRAGVWGLGCIYMRGRAVYREEAVEPPPSRWWY